MSVDWKNVATLDPETVKDHSEMYVRAIALKKDWDKLLTLSSDVCFGNQVIKALKIPFVYKTIFEKMSCADIVSVLDRANDTFRKAIFCALLKRYDALPAAREVGPLLRQNTDKYPWAVRYSPYLMSLETEEVLKQEIRAVSDPVGESWDAVLAVSRLKWRKAIPVIVCENYIEQLGAQSKTLAAAFSLLKIFAPLWSPNKELFEKVKTAVNAAQWIWTPGMVSDLARCGAQLQWAGGTFHFFHKLGIVDDSFITETFVRSFEKEADKPIAQQRLMQKFIQLPCVYQYTNDVTGNFVASMYSLSKHSPEDPLAGIWKRMEAVRPSILADWALQNSWDTFQYIVRALIDGQDAIKLITLDQIREIVAYVGNTIIQNKEALSKANSLTYTRLVARVIFFVLLVNPLQYENYDVQPTLRPNGVALISDALRDQLLLEFVLHPSGSMPLNEKLANLSFCVAMRYALLAESLTTVAQCVDFKSKAAGENFGFIDNFAVNLPPLPTQELQTAESVTGTFHLFERQLFKRKLLQSADVAVAREAIHLYQKLTKKILTQAVKLNDQKLTEYAFNTYLRFLRFTIGKTRDELSSEYLQLFMEMITDESGLCIGHRCSKTFAQDLFSKLIVHLHVNIESQKLLIIVTRLVAVETNSEAEMVAAELAPMILDHVLTKVPQAMRFTLHLLYPGVNDLTASGTEAFAAVWKERSEVVFPLPFCKLVTTHLLGKKAKKRFVAPVLSPETMLLSAAWTRTRHFSMKVALSLLAPLNERVDGYQPAQKNHATTNAILVFREWFINLTRLLCGRISIMAPLPKCLQCLPKSCTIQRVSQFLSRANVELGLVPGLLPVLTAYAKLSQGPDSPSAKFLEELQVDANYQAFQKLMRFMDYDQAAVTGSVKVVQREPHNPPVSLQFVGHPYLKDYLADDQAKAKRIGEKAAERQLMQSQYVGEFASFAYSSWLDADLSTFLEKVPVGKLLFSVCTHLAILLQYLPTGTDVKVPCHLINILLKDIALMPQAPTNDNPSPPPLVTLFSGANIATPAQKKAKGKRSAQMRDCSAEYRPNCYLLFRLASELHRHHRNVDLAIFGDELVKVLQLPENIQLSKLGNTNAFNFTDAICRLILSKMKVDDEIRTPAYAANPDREVYLYYWLLSSPVFHHVAANFLFQLLILLPVGQRWAILSRFAAAYNSTEFAFSLNFRKQLIMWMMTPAIVGPSLPKFVLDFLAQIVDDVKMHLDLRRALFANAVALFRFQADARMEPVDIDQIFAILKKAFSATDSLLPFVVCTVRESFVDALRSRSHAIAQLLPPNQAPIDYVTLAQSSIAFPTTGSWSTIYERYLIEFIGPGILSSNSQVLQAVIIGLTMLCTSGGGLTKMVAPFLAKGLQKVGPGRSSENLVGFAYQLCFSYENRDLEEPIKELCELFKRLHAFAEEMNQRLIAAYIQQKTNEVSETRAAVEKFVDTFIDPVYELVDRVLTLRGQKESLEWVRVLAERIAACLPVSKSRLVPSLNELSNIFQIMASADFVEALSVPADETIPWAPVLRLMSRTQYESMFEKLYKGTGAMTVDDVKLLCELPPFKLPSSNFDRLMKKVFADRDDDFKKEYIPKLREFVLHQGCLC